MMQNGYDTPEGFPQRQPQGYAFDNFDQMRDEYRQKSLMEFIQRLMMTPDQARAKQMQAGQQAAAVPQMGAGGDYAQAPVRSEEAMSRLARLRGPATETEPDLPMPPAASPGDSERAFYGAPEVAKSVPSASKKAAGASPTKTKPASSSLNTINRSPAFTGAPAASPSPSGGLDPTGSAAAGPGGFTPSTGGGFLDFFKALLSGGGSPGAGPFSGDPMSGAGSGMPNNPGAIGSALANQMKGGSPYPPAPPQKLGPHKPRTIVGDMPLDPIESWKRAVWGDQQ